MNKRTRWTPEREALLRKDYPTGDTSKLAAKLGVSEDAIMSKASTLGVAKEPGAKKVWNRGRKMPLGWIVFGGDPGATNRGKVSPKRKPLGTESTTARGEVFVKVSETGKPRVDWQRKNRMVWETHNGRKLEHGEVVYHIDGDDTNFNIENLAVGTRAEVMARNSIHNLPKEVGRIYHAIGTIRKLANNRKTKK